MSNSRDIFSLNSGYTLIELVLSLVLSLMIISWIYAYCNSHYKSHKTQTLINEMNQNIRVSMNKIISEVRMAGYKTGSSASDIMTNTATWTAGLIPSVPYTVNMNDNLVITDGGSTKPDMTTFIYADNEPTSLSQAAAQNNISITLSLSTGGIAEKFSAGQIVYIGFGTTQGSSLEYAKITSINGQTLWIDTDPNTPAMQDGLKNSYRTGTEAGKMNVVTYTVFNKYNDPSYSNHKQGHPMLKRKCNTSGMIQLANNIESLQIIAIDNENLQITLRARTSKEDDDYLDTFFGNGYRRRTLTSLVQIRNK